MILARQNLASALSNMANFFSKLNPFSKKANAGDPSQKLAEVLGAWYDTEAGIHVSPSNALSIMAVFACIRVLTESVGMLPLNLMRHVEKSREKAINNSLYWLMQDGPNDFLTAQEYKELIIAHLAIKRESLQLYKSGRRRDSRVVTFAASGSNPSA